MIRWVSFLLGCIGGSLALKADTLSYAKYIEIVEKNHPVVLRSSLYNAIAKSQVTLSRGDMDPKITGDLRQKYFDEKNYYSLLDAGLKIPTWLGTDFLVGFNQNRGFLLNPEETINQNGLWYAGLETKIGNGLLMDKRRMAIKSAVIEAQRTSIEQEYEKTLLLVKASNDYFHWQASWYILEAYKTYLKNAQARFLFVKKEHNAGNKPAIDTTEAFIQFTNATMAFTDAKLTYNNALAQINIHLWLEGNIPLELSENVLPEDYKNTKLNLQFIPASLDYTHLEQHPLVIDYDLKNQYYQLKQRLAQESLKPSLNIKYNLLSNNSSSNRPEAFAWNDYKWMAGVSMPLFFRKGIGALKAAKTNLAINEISQKEKLFQLQIKREQTLNAINTLNEQTRNATINTANYLQLFQAEQTLFTIGESSLFLINSRENKYIEAQIKQYQIYQKFFEKKVRLNLY